jgi:AcrR family transcriptional regulator
MNEPDDPRRTYITIAAQKFAKDGFHGTSLAALAKEAGVTKQALLHFFGTKERLYAEVLKDLAARLCEEIDATTHPDPATHLITYLTRFGTTAWTEPQDARLVVRALLDSDPQARVWPMKPYLDKLVVLAQATPGGQRQKPEATHAWVFQIIGALQYWAISATALNGMYGEKTSEALARQFDTDIARQIRDFVA